MIKTQSNAIQPYENGMAYLYLKNAISRQDPDIVRKYFQLEWESETSFITPQELDECLDVLVENGDSDFKHYQDIRTLFDENKPFAAVQWACGAPDSLGGVMELQSLAKDMITVLHHPSVYPPVVKALQDRAGKDPRFYYYIGRIICSENNLNKNQEAGVRAYELGAEAGSQRCQYALCLRYLHAPKGKGLSKGKKLLEKYARKGNYRAMVKLAFYLLSDPDFPDEERALELLEQAIGYPNPVTAYILLACYYHNKGNLDLAIFYAGKYDECSEGCPWYDELCALYLTLYFEKNPLGCIPQMGEAVTQSLVVAACQYRFNSAYPTPDKQGTKSDFMQGLAESNPACGYYLALMYEHGHGVQKRSSKAVKWMQEAAQASFVPAMIRLAEYYETGYAVEQSLYQAIELYEKVLEMSYYRHTYVADKLAKLKYLVD